MACAWNVGGGGKTPDVAAAVDSTAARLTILRRVIISDLINSTDSSVLRKAPVSAHNSSMDASTWGFHSSNTRAASSNLSMRPMVVRSTALIRGFRLASMMEIEV
jgi:hypothetical protein